jgi:trans-2,3-dihydro-3-hydroxyanthranilate isomerase
MQRSRKYRFETVDVFTDQRFGGNPLAVVTDATGLSNGEMQALAAEFNLSETTFVLPPETSGHTARVRIFNRTAEMPFAGHPSIGTAYILAQSGAAPDCTTFEMVAGLVNIRIERDENGRAVGASLDAPQPLSLGPEVDPKVVAACATLRLEDVITHAHAPIVASVGNPYVIAEVREDALRHATPLLSAFRDAATRYPEMKGRFSLHLYARAEARIRARMFAPLAGTFEDPATGSANAPLAGLLLANSDTDFASYSIDQGIEMGRPSRLEVTARRAADGIRTTGGGRCVSVFSGEISM